jgi:C_GCAxxG_C_C family probable redox protein
MDAFGGGLAAQGEVCGAVVGGLAAISLKYGRPRSGNEPDMRMWRYSDIFIRRFKEEVSNGKTLCRDIAGVDWRRRDQVKKYQEGEKRSECSIITGKTAKIVGELLER